MSNQVATTDGLLYDAFDYGEFSLPLWLHAVCTHLHNDEYI